jgi:hypothetical protein
LASPRERKGDGKKNAMPRLPCERAIVACTMRRFFLLNIVSLAKRIKRKRMQLGGVGDERELNF